MSHTPGPWEVDCARNRAGAYNNVSAPGKAWPDSQIGLVSCDNPSYRANCALISAAPDLLAALKNIVANRPAFRSKPVGAPGSDARMQQDHEIQLEDEALRAIAKATGDTGFREAILRRNAG